MKYTKQKAELHGSTVWMIFFELHGHKAPLCRQGKHITFDLDEEEEADRWLSDHNELND